MFAGLHSDSLLTEEEYYAMEDLCADFLETRSAVGGNFTSHQEHYDRTFFSEMACL